MGAHMVPKMVSVTVSHPPLPDGLSGNEDYNVRTSVFPLTSSLWVAYPPFSCMSSAIFSSEYEKKFLGLYLDLLLLLLLGMFACLSQFQSTGYSLARH